MGIEDYIKGFNRYKDYQKRLKIAREKIWEIYHEKDLDSYIEKLQAQGKKMGRYSKGCERKVGDNLIMEIWEYSKDPNIKDVVLCKITVAI